VNKLVFILIFVFVTVTGFCQVDYKTQREYMVRTQIKARGIENRTTLNAMLKVPRHEFVPADGQKQAYIDGPLSIGYGQTISQPYIVAYMTEELKLKPDYKVLEIGTGSGYQAAVLSEIIDSVYTIEIIKELGLTTKNKLKRLGYNNINVKLADGYYGWEEKGPFDAIIVTAAAEYVPPPLIAQLKEGGRMLIPVGRPFFVQQLILVEKKEKKVKTKSLMGVRFVPFTRTKK
jgi:protein-L-isoaspartate(D-aspartate) O-methyltransferase